jgi:hypothetical protein
MLLGLSGDASYQVGALRLRGEIASWKVGDADTISHATGEAIPGSLMGAYGEAGFNVLSLITPEATSELIPFFRYETISITPHDLAATSQNFMTFGVAYKPLDNVILKVDYRTSNSDVVSEKGKLNLGAGYAF